MRHPCSACAVPDGIWHQRSMVDIPKWKAAAGPRLGEAEWSMSAPSCVAPFNGVQLCQSCRMRAEREVKAKGKKK